MSTLNPEHEPVAAVCGSEVRIYGPMDSKTQVRPLLRVFQFNNHGQAVLFAREHDEKRR